MAETSQPPAGAAGPARWALVATVAAAVVAIDQVTKTLAVRHLSTVVDGALVAQPRHIVASLYLWLTLNSGIAFGLGRGAQPVIEAVVVLLVAGLLVFGRRAARHSTRAEAVGVALLIGGALGNLGDRLFRNHGGAVIDFIDIAQIHGHEYWPVFNVADMSVVTGAVLLAWCYSVRSRRRTPPARGGPAAGPGGGERPDAAARREAAPRSHR